MITNIMLFTVILFVIIIIYSIIVKFDIISPTITFIGSFLLCSLAYMNIIDFWKTDLRSDTILLMSVSCITFMIVSTFVDYYFHNNRRISKTIFKFHEISKSVYLFFAFVSLIYILIGFQNINLYTSIEYKKMISENAISSYYISIQINKILLAFSYVALYKILVNIIVKKMTIKSQCLGIITIILCNIAFSMTGLSRQNFIEFIIASFTIWIVLKRKIGEIAIKDIFYPVITTLILPIAFFYSSDIVGRDFNRISTYGAQRYVSIYMSCGINFFNKEIIDKPFNTEYIGQSSFAGMFKNLIGILIPENVQDMTKHYFSIDYGNTVTMFGRWYEDGGAVMVLLMTIILAIITTYYYNKYIKYKNDFSFHLIIYAKYIGVLLWAGYDNRLALLISLDQCQQVAYLYILFVLLLKTKVRIKLW